MTKFPLRRITPYIIAILSIATPLHATELICWETRIDTPPGIAYQCTPNGKDSKITPEQRQILNTIIVVTVIAAAATRIRTR